MYEQGKLKDQKLNRKQLRAAPEFKQHHFQSLHTLDTSFQQSILEKVADGEMTLSEMKEAAAHYRSMEQIKRGFIRCTNSRNWEAAVSVYPSFASEERLDKFIVFDLKKGIPDVFRTYCQTAIDSISDNGPQNERRASMTFKVGEVAVHLVEGDLTKLSAQDIKKVHPPYSGAHLILTQIQNVSP